MKITMPLLAAVAVIVTAPVAQAQMKLPDLKKQPTPQAVLDEHFAALNACDWDRLLAQYPEDAQINLPNGMIVNDEKDKRVYTLSGDTAGVKPGQRMTFQGKKTKPNAGNPLGWEISKIRNDYGVCQP